MITQYTQPSAAKDFATDIRRAWLKHEPSDKLAWQLSEIFAWLFFAVCIGELVWIIHN